MFKGVFKSNKGYKSDKAPLLSAYFNYQDQDQDQLNKITLYNRAYILTLVWGCLMCMGIYV